MSPRHRAITLTLLASTLATQAATAQQAGTGQRNTAADSAIIAREQGMWDALKNKDVAAFNRLAGNSRAISIVSSDGIAQASSNEIAQSISSNCQTGSNRLDSTKVEHLGENAVMLTYKVTLDRTCGNHKLPGTMYAMSLWARRNGRWQAVAQSVTPAQARSQ